MLLTHLQELDHWIAGACKQGVEHGHSGQRRIDLALCLGLSALALTSKRDFSFMGKMLFVGTLVAFAVPMAGWVV